MKRTACVLTRFDVGDGFYVEVAPQVKRYKDEPMTEFVLCKENYGFKSYMFGLMSKDCPEDVWEDLIEGNVDNYIEGFIEDMNVWENAFEDGMCEYDDDRAAVQFMKRLKCTMNT